MGEPESAVRRLNFSQAFNPLGAITGVLIGTVFIFSGVELKPADIASFRYLTHAAEGARDLEFPLSNAGDDVALKVVSR